MDILSIRQNLDSSLKKQKKDFKLLCLFCLIIILCGLFCFFKIFSLKRIFKDIDLYSVCKEKESKNNKDFLGRFLDNIFFLRDEIFYSSNTTMAQNLGEKDVKSGLATVFISNSNDESESLEESIDEQLKDIDLSAVENNFKKLSEKDKFFLGENSFLKVIKKFIKGEDSGLYEDFLPYAISIVFDDLLSLLPYFAVIIAVAILYSLVGHLSCDKGLNNIIHLVCFSTIAGVVIKIVLGLMNSSTNAISVVEGQMEAIFPIILTLITAVGGVVTASTFEPFLAILTSGITKLFSSFLVPIFIFSIVFGVVGNLSKNVKLEKFSKFFTSLFNCIVGVVFTVFMAFLTLHGLTVSTVDTISIKTTKYAIKNYIPIVGSYLSDGVSLILASSVLIKNAIGVGGLIVLFLCLFSPIIQIIVVQLLLKLTSAILEPICDKETPDFLYSISKSLNMLLVSLIAIGFMFLISVSILMCCSNLF